MKKRLVYLLLAVGLAMVGALTALTYPAAAETKRVCVQLPDGKVLNVDLPVVPGVAPIPPGTILDPSRCVSTTPAPTPVAPPTSTNPQAIQPGTTGTTPKSTKKTPPKRKPSSKKQSADAKKKAAQENKAKAKAKLEAQRQQAAVRAKKRPAVTRTPGGAPTALAPSFMDAVPGAALGSGVPNFVIDKFRVPVFLLPIYQAAGIQYGVRWEVLAAINEIETDYGRNLSVSSAGALGWMQFIPSTWRMYGVDANKDGKKDPFNPVDAIFAAARYLKAAGYEKDARRAVFAYNHATWYVDSVMLRAKLIAGVPADLVGSLTGLTEGRFPIAARARYADDLQEAAAARRAGKSQNTAAALTKGGSGRKQIQIFARKDSPVVATQDGQIKQITRDSVVLQDAYGNRYSYRGLGSVAPVYPVPRDTATNSDPSAVKALKANDPASRDPKPSVAASAGRQPTPKGPGKAKAAKRTNVKAVAKPQADTASSSTVGVKRRLFAHPSMPGSRDAGGLDQLLEARSLGGSGDGVYSNYFARPFGVGAKNVKLTRLRAGSQVIAGTVLGRIGGPKAGKAPHIDFSIRPAGKGAPVIDPKPILDGWKLLEATAIYRASGRNALYGDSAGGLSIGQVLLLSKPLLEKRVLADPAIQIYAGGRQDIQSGQIDRRVLATLEYLSLSGLKPTVTSLKGNHGLMTASGNVSEHSSGNAVDIGAINNIPILGHQDPGGITEQAVRRLMQLQGTQKPHQIISLLNLGANTMSLPDHANHIHIGYHPNFGFTAPTQDAMSTLKPGQWSNLINHLSTINQPTVPTHTSKYALPAGRKRN